jgi:hypothetical protein
MTVDEAINYFGSRAYLCKALSIKVQNVNYWNRIGRISSIQQIRLEKLTNGALKVDNDEFFDMFKKQESLDSVL